MNKMLVLSLALAAAASVSACQTPQQQNAFVGGALGLRLQRQPNLRGVLLSKGDANRPTKQ